MLKINFLRFAINLVSRVQKNQSILYHDPDGKSVRPETTPPFGSGFLSSTSSFGVGSTVGLTPALKDSWMFLRDTEAEPLVLGDCCDECGLHPAI